MRFFRQICIRRAAETAEGLSWRICRVVALMGEPGVEYACRDGPGCAEALLGHAQ